MSRFIFPQWTQTLNRWVGILMLGAPVYLVLLIYLIAARPETLRIGYQPVQPVPYSHALHAGQLGMDCRYCHSTVEKGAKAAVPPSAVCMNCHNSVLPQSPKLQPVRDAFAGKAPVKWVRVHDLPDYVYFNHSAHVTRGIGCESCHGRIDQMEKVHTVSPMTMSWCLDCHRNPEPNLRDPAKVTAMGYQASAAEAAQVRKDHQINPPTDCSTCHR